MTPRDAKAFAFLQDAPGATSLDELTSMFGACAEAFGFAYFGCVHFGGGTPVNPAMLFGRASPDWQRKYLDENLVFDDPSIGMIFDVARPFSWAEVEAASLAPRSRRVFDVARREGFESGFLVPVTGPFRDVIAVMMTSDLALDHDRRERSTLTAIATVYATVGKSFNEVAADEPTTTPLTRRECECLSWAAGGKTDWEIGFILGIAPRTVGLHVDNARAKMGAANRARAVIEAWRRGWLLDALHGDHAPPYGESRIH